MSVACIGVAHLLEDLADQLVLSGIRVETGQFGAHMSVSLVNDGPVTFLLSV